MDFNLIIEAYIKLRDAKHDLADKHRAEMSVYNDRMHKIETIIAAHLQSNGLKTIKGKGGSAHMVSKVSYKIDNLDLVWERAVSENRPDIFERRINPSVADELGDLQGVERKEYLKTTVVRA